ncbi:hypothetical protein [Sulfurimonas microaerophilic]|uniref:hypothetical protein n=1 Tax=Sulfurimonas microaerophilic TaxID=3058392 RepID=UPI0027148D8A|nr:hypothetical protein [Sulfurimonas sp. hsl 1-7]
MVKNLLLVFLFLGNLYAQEAGDKTIATPAELLSAKIQGFVSEATYKQNLDFINAVFDPKSAYFKNDRVDSVKVIQTLQDNGLLNLFFETPQEIRLNFRTNGSPIFFVKIIGDTLSSLGYYKYVTVASTRDASEFIWSINLTSEYATDPLLLQKELKKKLCEIVDIQRDNAKEWSYLIDISHAKLNVEQLENGKQTVRKRSLYEHWFDVSKIKTLDVQSSSRNHWYPYIAYYDSSLHLLKVIKKETIYKGLYLEIPKNANYMKISDLYTLKNIKDELIFYPKGSR